MATLAAAQFPADSTLPREKRGDGKSRKFAPGPTPRTKEGTPDLSGVWGYAGYTSDIAKDYDVGTVPMTPLAEKLFKERQANQGIYDPEARCLPTGVPRRDPYPSKIFQTPSVDGDSLRGQHAQLPADFSGPHDASARPAADVVWRLDRQMGGRRAGGGYGGLQREDLARSRRPPDFGPASRDRTLLAAACSANSSSISRSRIR